jgi:hypothetical protein
MFRAHVALFATSAVWLLLPDAAHAQTAHRPTTHGRSAAPHHSARQHAPTAHRTTPQHAPTARRSTPQHGRSATSRSARQTTRQSQPTGRNGLSSRAPGYRYSNNTGYYPQQSGLNGYYANGYSFFNSSFNPSGQNFFGRYYYNHGYSFFDPPTDTPLPLVLPPLQGVGGPADPQQMTPPAGPLVARLNIQLPAVAEVWMDGELQPGRSATWELTSLPLPHPWSAHLFDVAARWSAGGQTFEWENKVPVVAGHTGQSLVARGYPVTTP